MRSAFGFSVLVLTLLGAGAAFGQAPPPPPPPLKTPQEAAPPKKAPPPPTEKKAPPPAEKKAPPPAEKKAPAPTPPANTAPAPAPEAKTQPPASEQPAKPTAPAPTGQTPPPAAATPPADGATPAPDGATPSTPTTAAPDEKTPPTSAETPTPALTDQEKAEARRRALTGEAPAEGGAAEPKTLTPEEAAAERRRKAREAERTRQGGASPITAPELPKEVKVDPQNFTLPVIAGLGTGAALSAATLAAGATGLVGVYLAATPTGAQISWLPITLMALGLGGGFILGPVGAIATAAVASYLSYNQQGEDAARKTAYGALAGVVMAFGGLCGAPALAAFMGIGSVVFGVFIAELTYFWLGAACGTGLCGLGLAAAGPVMAGVGAMSANLSYTEAVAPPEEKKPQKKRRRRRPRRRPVSMAF